MIVYVKIDRDTIEKIDEAGRQLNIFTYNTKELINSLCDKAVKLHTDLKTLLDSLLPFLEEHHFDQSEIAKLTLKIYKNQFQNG